MQVLIASEVFLECLPSRNTGLLEFDDDQRKAIYKADQIRTAGIEIAGDRHLADEQKVVSVRVLPIDDPHPLSFLPAALPIRNRDLDAVSQQLPNFPVRRGKTHRRPIACKLIDSGFDRISRKRRIQPLQRRAESRD